MTSFQTFWIEPHEMMWMAVSRIWTLAGPQSFVTFLLTFPSVLIGLPTVRAIHCKNNIHLFVCLVFFLIKPSQPIYLCLTKLNSVKKRKSRHACRSQIMHMHNPNPFQQCLYSVVKNSQPACCLWSHFFHHSQWRSAQAHCSEEAMFCVCQIFKKTFCQIRDI